MNTKTIIILILIAAAIFLGVKLSASKKDIQSESMMASTETLENLDITAEETVPTENTNLTTKSISANESSLNWTAQKKVLTNWIDKGTVKILSGSASFNGANLVSGVVVVDMNSINALSTGAGGNQSRLTTHVKSADFFDVANYPTAKLVIKSVSNGTANADITIKGVTKPITFPVTVSSDMSKVTGKLTVNRADFGVKFGSTSFFQNLADNAIVDDIFTIDFNIVLK